MNSVFMSGFILGGITATVARYCLTYFGNKQNNEEEQIKSKRLEIESLFDDYPDFMNLFKNNIDSSDSANIREFLVVEKNAILNSSVSRFRFDLTPDILPVLNKMENLGYILRLENNCLHYKISDEFFSRIKLITYNN